MLAGEPRPQKFPQGCRAIILLPRRFVPLIRIVADPGFPLDVEDLLIVGRPPLAPSERFSAFAGGFRKTSQGTTAFSFSNRSPASLSRT